jgi:chromosome partitioning protein
VRSSKPQAQTSAPPSLAAKGIRAIISETDVAIVPLSPSIFDELATLRFLKRLEGIKSVRKGKKKIVLVANRYHEGRRSSLRLEEWLLAEGLVLTARIPERELYSDVARKGLTIFDRRTRAALEQQQAWLPLVRAIETTAENQL